MFVIVSLKFDFRTVYNTMVYETMFTNVTYSYSRARMDLSCVKPIGCGYSSDISNFVDICCFSEPEGNNSIMSNIWLHHMHFCIRSFLKS